MQQLVRARGHQIGCSLLVCKLASFRIDVVMSSSPLVSLQKPEIYSLLIAGLDAAVLLSFRRVFPNLPDRDQNRGFDCGCLPLSAHGSSRFNS